MNTHLCRALVAICIAIAFSQCQSQYQSSSQDRAHLDYRTTQTANYPTMEQKTVMFGGRKFVQQRNVVCTRPLETQIITKEL